MAPAGGFAAGRVPPPRLAPGRRYPGSPQRVPLGMSALSAAMETGDQVLIVDAGNTWVKASLASGDGIRLAERIPTASFGEGASSGAAGGRLPAVAVLACVARRAGGPVAAWLRSRGVERVLRIGPDLPVPLRLDYETPETLGQDRLVVAFEAFRRSGGGAVVVDAGTAITVDVVDSGGVFRGGAIAPGLAALAAGLRAAAPGLPGIDGVSAVYPGRSSAGCVSAGAGALLEGGVGLLVERARSLLAGGPPVWITGGDARTVARLLPGIEWRCEPLLMEAGMYRIWREAGGPG